MADTDLVVSENTIAVGQIHDSRYYAFFIPTLTASTQKYYYAFLELTGSGVIRVGEGTNDTYLNGSLYRNGNPEESQAAFQLIYSRRKAFLGLGLEGLTWSGILVIALFCFILPGWGILCLLWPTWSNLGWPEKLGLSAGLSLAIYPLLLLWTDLLGLHLGAIYAWLPPLVGLSLILWRNRLQLHSVNFKGPFLIRLRPFFRPKLSDAMLLVTLAFIIFTRFWAIRSLDLPMWGDSYQHTMIAQLLVDHGGLFTSWQPYADLTTFTYHFGFHSAVAVFDWITHIDMARAVLWVGQIMNILAIIVLYPLATKVSHNRWAGVSAVLVAGLLSSMPLYYVNWGRYTQLAGQVILPVVAWVMWDILANNLESTSTKKLNIGSLIIGSLSFAGLALAHYRILILGVIFLIPLWIGYARQQTWRLMLQKTFWLGIGGGLLFMPWFIRVFGGRILRMFVHQITVSAAQAIETDPQGTTISNLTMYLPLFLWLTLLAVIGIGLWRREKAMLVFLFWWVINFFAANPWLLRLPGAGLVTGFAFYIAMYIPAGVLLGAAVAWLNESRLKGIIHALKVHRIFSVIAVVFLIGICLWGTRLRLRDVRESQFALGVRPDVMAAEWLSQNTPAGASLLVNSMPAFHNSVIVGSDGGWWLPLLAHRSISVPPINYAFEKDPWPGYLNHINALTFDIQSKGIQNPAVIAELHDRGISYVYIGQRQGSVGSSGPLLKSADLLASSAFHLVYHQDGVWIFQIQ